jgi:RNA-binding protein
MTSLTGTQRKHLRGLAHHLDPLVHVGQKGLTDALVEEVDHALKSHELLKIRFQDHKDEKKDITRELAERTSAAEVGGVGHVMILYRPHPEPEKRKIRLP